MYLNSGHPELKPTKSGPCIKQGGEGDHQVLSRLCIKNICIQIIIVMQPPPFEASLVGPATSTCSSFSRENLNRA